MSAGAYGVPQALVSVSGLTKRYGRTLALDDLTLPVPQGAVFGLLGPNGSGKSTLIKLLLGFIFPDAGRIEWGRTPVGQATPAPLSPVRIGYLPERPFFPPRSTLEEYLLTAGRLSGMQELALHQTVAHRLEQLGLAEMAGRRINTCSRGMLQRLGLATSLLDSPPLLLWDEPMSGLDPAWQKYVRELIRGLAAEGTTLLLSTHDLSEVEQVCTHVAIVYRGRLIRQGSLAEVLACRPEVTIAIDDLPDCLAEALPITYPGLTVDGSLITLRDEAIAHKTMVLRTLLEGGADILRLAQTRVTLEQIYMEAVRK